MLVQKAVSKLFGGGGDEGGVGGCGSGGGGGRSCGGGGGGGGGSGNMVMVVVLVVEVVVDVEVLEEVVVVVVVVVVVAKDEEEEDVVAAVAVEVVNVVVQVVEFDVEVEHDIVRFGSTFSALTVLFLGIHKQLPSRSPILRLLWPPTRLTWNSHDSEASELPKSLVLDEGGHVHISHITPPPLVDVRCYNPPPLRVRRPRRHTRTTRQSGSDTK
ncbi:hypothetical protein L3X38_038124 [Prunus dulcis]|uniref:Uncharacterized protein n=1 Tax=Prunus dulcis TaxID=3755 RepID=A0AAD4V5Y6_PRUDU|nr:hypothetical protein L3X38_038124 [Prunus dulcis]